MTEPVQIAPGPIYQRQEPVRDEAYKRYIRLLPCVVCLKHWRVEAAHVGPHGMGQKASDHQTIPLCHKHHRAADDSLHKLGPVAFSERHRLDIDALVTMFQSFYQTKLSRKFPNVECKPECGAKERAA